MGYGQEVTELDVKLARIIRNGVLGFAVVLLFSMSTCYTADKHYEYLNHQAERQHYLTTRPW